MALEVKGLERVIGSNVALPSAFQTLSDGPTTVGVIRALLELAVEGAGQSFRPVEMFDERGKAWRSIRAFPGLLGANNVTASFRVWLVEHRPGADLDDDETEIIVHNAGDLVCVAANRTWGGLLLPSTHRPCDSMTWTATTWFTNLVTDIGGGARAHSPGSDAVGDFRIVDTWGMSVWFEPILAGGSPATGADLLVDRIV